MSEQNIIDLGAQLYACDKHIFYSLFIEDTEYIFQKDQVGWYVWNYDHGPSSNPIRGLETFKKLAGI